MYHRKLKIQIYSETLFLENELRKQSPLERFEHEFETLDHIDCHRLQNCDIAVVDLPVEKFHPELHRAGEAGTCLILCAAPEEIPHWKDRGSLFEDFWLKPLDGTFARARFLRLLEIIRLKKEEAISKNYLDSAINSIPDLVWFKDIRGAHLKVNDAFCHAVGKEKSDVEGRGHYYIWDLEPEDYEKGEYVCLETEETVLREKRTFLFDEKVLSKHGLRQFKTYKSPIFDENGEVLGTVGIAHDVTDLENIGTELQIVLNSLPFAILVKDTDGRIINANEKFSEYFKTKRKVILGQDYDHWKNRVFESLSPVGPDGYAEAVLMVKEKEMILELHEEPIYDIFENLVGQFCICRDVTVERELERQILYNSNTDFLTGLYNRRYFYEYVAKTRGNQSISAIYADLDHFKQVNDHYGHQAGDEALVLTAELLRETFPDAFIARIGGDEFLITLIGGCEVETLKARSEALLDRIKEAFASFKQLSILSASIGIAQTNDPELEIDTLIRQSDLALYEAKARGRSQYCVYTPELLEKSDR